MNEWVNRMHHVDNSAMWYCLGRSTYMSADLYFTTDSSFSFFFCRLISELAERNSTKIGHMLGSNCNLKMHVQNLGYPFPLQIGGPKATFLDRLRNLTATLIADIFGTKHDIDNWSSALTTTRGLLHPFKMSWTLVHKRLQSGPSFFTYHM